MTAQEERGPLAGVRILDLTRVLAGPFGTMLLGDAGAEIVKVEPLTGDQTRTWGPPFVGGEAAYYLSVNRNKRSLALNLADPRGQEVLRRLAREADALVENFKLGTMERWGLGYANCLRPLNPRLVYLSISGFGRQGPYAERPGYDVILEAFGGLMSITGEPDGEPMKVGVAIIDVLTGALAAYAVAAALLERERTGKGQEIDLSLLDAQVAALANQAGSYLASGEVPKRYGNSHPSIVPYQVFRARDRRIMVAVGNDRQFRTLCEELGRPELAEDARFSTNPKRVEHREELVPELEAAFRERSAEEWEEDLNPLGVPVAPINSLDRALTHPQVLFRELVRTVSHPTAGEIRIPGPPVRFPGGRKQRVHSPPLLGEHTWEILRSAGYRDEEIRALVDAKVVGE